MYASLPASVPARGTHNRQLLRLLARPLPRVPPLEEELKEVAEKLKRNVLEGKGRSMEELEDVCLLVELLERRDVRVAEGAI